MPERCTCGAQLPPDARFCHKCGKPQGEWESEPEVALPPPLPVITAPQPVEISFGNGSAVRAGFLAALVGVLLVLFPLPFPIVRLLLSLLAAGFFAVFLYIRRTGQQLTLKQGARIGWITGIFAFTIFTLQLTLGVVTTPPQGGLVNAFKQHLPPNDPATSQMLEMLSSPAALAVIMLFVLFVFFVLLTILPTIGGLLGAKVLAREPQSLH